MPLKPEKNDVLFGRGSVINSHSGNIHLRSLTDGQTQNYLKAKTKAERRHIAFNIYEAIKSLDPPGRFLIEDPHVVAKRDGNPITSKSVWMPVEEAKALDKILNLIVRQRQGKKADNRGYRQQNTFKGSFMASKSVTDLEISAGRGDQILPSMDADHGIMHDANAKSTRAVEIKTEEVGRNLQLNDAKTVGAQNDNDEQFRELEISAEEVNQNLISLDEMLDGKLLASREPIRPPDMSAKGIDQNSPFVDAQNVGMLNGNLNSIKAIDMSVTQKNGNLQLLDGKVAYLKDANNSNESNMTTSMAFGMSADGIDQNLHSLDTNHFEINSSNTMSGGRPKISARRVGQDGSILNEEHLRLIDAKAKSTGSSDLTNRDVNHNLQLLDKESMEVHSFEINRLKSSNFFQLYKIKTDISGGSQTTQNFVQITLREWIEISSPKKNGCVAIEDVPDYIEAALHVALELARCLARSEAVDNDGISIASISAENVRVQVAPKLHAWLPQNIKAYGDETDDRCCRKIHGVRFLPSTDSTAGCNSSRLFALGLVFLELFSYGNEILSEGTLKSIYKYDVISSMAMMGINNGDCDVTQKKSSAGENYGSSYGGLMYRLRSLGIQEPVCILLRNLLDCVNGDFCGNEAYKAFAEVKLDLQLMIDDPLRFVHNANADQSPQIVRRDKLYGREESIRQLKNAYLQSYLGKCNGVLIRGEAGVGKSKLSMAIEQIAKESNGYFSRGKFDQNHEIKPLSVIGGILRTICNMVVDDVLSNEDGTKLANSLEYALGSQACVLAQIVPSLSKLMPLQQSSCSSLQCFDLAESVRFLVSTLLYAITNHFSKPIFIVFDDVQWADAASLQMFTSLLCIEKNVFFTFCCRDDDTVIQAGDPFQFWLQSISNFSLQQIHVTNLDDEGVNNLVSDALCVSPRLTRPLSKVIHHKTLGNPFFVWQLLFSLEKNRMIYFSLKESRFTWDIGKICNMEVSDDVLSLLIRDMKKLPSDIQMGLKAVSCIGASINEAVAEILSSHLGANLGSILEKASRKGYMERVTGTKDYRFVHDRVQQAAYEMIPEEDRRLYHMDFGLSICSRVLNHGENGAEFFTAVNQMNQGGPEILADPSQKPIIARLNLDAGAKCIELSDYASAVKFFRNGVTFLGPNHWYDQYDLSIELYDSVANAACDLNDLLLAEGFARKVIIHAKCFEHKLNALYITAKSSRKRLSRGEAIHYVLSALNEIGENTTSIGEEEQLFDNVRSTMNSIASVPDEIILNFKMAGQKKIICCMNMYSELLYSYHLSAETTKLFRVTLRMVQLTMENGLTSFSPFSFANFGLAAVAVGNFEFGYRMGSLALKLSHRIRASESASNVIVTVKWFIAWVLEPLQSISESLEIGYNVGNQTGDIYSAIMNKHFSLSIKFLSGTKLGIVRNQTLDFIKKLQTRKQEWCIYGLAVTYSISVFLIEGLTAPWTLESVPNEDGIWALAKERNNNSLLLTLRCVRLMKAFFFRQSDTIRPTSCILDELTSTQTPLRPTYIVAVFFEGLACYHMARKFHDKKWTTRGDAAFSFIKTIGQSSPWTFENKILLLEAEKMYTVGSFEQSQELFKKAILSAKTHKFIHEEALSHELAGFMHLENQMPNEAVEYFTEAVSCYTKWGAFALAERIESIANEARYSHHFSSSIY